MTVHDLPIYKENFGGFLKIIIELDDLKESNQKHKRLIEIAYDHAVIIFPKLNAGYNYWSVKGKIQLYNNVRILLSELEIELSILKDLKLIEDEHKEIFNASIKYLNGLIRKFEQPSKNKNE